MLGLPNSLDKIMKTLAERLKYAMEILPPKKIKGVDLARAVGVRPPSVSDWLSGKSKTMEGENLLKAAKCLNVNPNWLASGIGTPQPIEASNSLSTSNERKLNQEIENIANSLYELDHKNKLSPKLIEVLNKIIDLSN